MKYLVTLLALIAIALIGWWVIYPGYDPRNLNYVLWKYNLAPIDLDRAAVIVSIDPDKNAVLLGRTKPELVQRFGYLKAPSEVAPYLRECAGFRPGADVMFLRNENTMIVFTNQRSTESVLCKGY